MTSRKPSSPILFDTLSARQGYIGLITLNRPNALNALNESMLNCLNTQLSAWGRQDDLLAVIIRGEGDQAFCAGGDLKSIYYNYSCQPLKPSNLFFEEYSANLRIFHFPKPYIALLHGITMGGGVGVGIHGTHRVASPDLRFAMPETSIGFQPDSGASYFFSRCPGHTGLYLALTGDTINHDDALALGLIDYIVPKPHFDDIINKVRTADLFASSQTNNQQVLDKLLISMAIPAESSCLLKHYNLIETFFGQNNVEAIFDGLRQDPSNWSRSVLEQLSQRCPTSLKVTFEAWHRAKQTTFDDCMQMEYIITQHHLKEPNFFEGIRARLIDKDRSPIWKPNDIKAVTADKVATYFYQEADMLTLPSVKAL